MSLPLQHNYLAAPGNKPSGKRFFRPLPNDQCAQPFIATHQAQPGLAAYSVQPILIYYMIRKLLLACLITAVMPLLPASAQVKVAIFSINDFHGGFVRNDAKNIPELPAIWQTIDSLKHCYPNHVTVAAGDNFGGSYFYSATRGALLPVFFDALGIRISALGNHEFDDGQRQLAAKWNTRPCVLQVGT